jgi:hypothetical protein
VTSGNDEGQPSRTAVSPGHPHEPVPDRIAEEIAEELHLRPVDTSEDEDDGPLPTMSEQISEQLGGVRGLVETSIPVMVFVLLNVVLDLDVIGLEKRQALYIAIAGSVGSALGIAGYRVYRRQTIRHAVNGLFGIVLGAYLAWRSGDAKDFYLPGILLTFGQAALLLVSVAFRRPAIGYVWAVMANKGKHDWLRKPRMLFMFQWLTVAWAVSLIVRAGVQWVLYLADMDKLLGLARIFLSWPIYAGMLALTVWVVRRTLHRERVETTAGA